MFHLTLSSWKLKATWSLQATFHFWRAAIPKVSVFIPNIDEVSSTHMQKHDKSLVTLVTSQNDALQEICRCLSSLIDSSLKMIWMHRCIALVKLKFHTVCFWQCYFFSAKQRPPQYSLLPWSFWCFPHSASQIGFNLPLSRSLSLSLSWIRKPCGIGGIEGKWWSEPTCKLNLPTSPCLGLGPPLIDFWTANSQSWLLPALPTPFHAQEVQYTVVQYMIFTYIYNILHIILYSFSSHTG